MTQVQAVLSTSTGAASLQPRSESNREAPAKAVTAVTLPERPIKSSTDVLSQPTQPTLSRDARDELASAWPSQRTEQLFQCISSDTQMDASQNVIIS